MKTLFGLSSNVAVVIVGSLYLVITLHTTVYGIRNFQKFLSGEHKEGYLFIDTQSSGFHIFSVVLSVSCLCSSILLILGILEKRYGILQPWLFVNFVLECILASIFCHLIFILTNVYKSSWINVCGILLAIFMTAVAMAFHDYIWNGIYSLYIKFRKDSRRLYQVIDAEDSRGIFVV